MTVFKFMIGIAFGFEFKFGGIDGGEHTASLSWVAVFFAKGISRLWDAACRRGGSQAYFADRIRFPTL